MKSFTYRAGSRILLVAVIALVASMESGCGVLPDRAGIYATHTSVPFAGAGPAPIGDNDGHLESNYEALRGSLMWERDGWTVASDVDFVVHSNNVAAPTGVLWSIRIGREVNLR